MTFELKTVLPTRLLIGTRDWYIWKTTIRELIEMADVWDYIDPDRKRLLDLEIPSDIDLQTFVEKDA